jgi:AcrR family transcriptional regulator
MPPAKRRLSREARYEQLLAAAAAIVTRQGPDALTMEAVAAASGVDKAIPYRHFANRDELLLVLWERATADFDARIERAVAAAGSLEAEIEAIVGVWLDDLEQRGLSTWLQAFEAQGGALAKRREQRLAHSARWIASRLRAHRRLTPQQALLAAGVLMAGTQGLLAAWRVTRSSRRTAIATFVRMAVGAVNSIAAGGR